MCVCVCVCARSLLPHQIQLLATGGALEQSWTRYQLLSQSMPGRSTTCTVNHGERSPLRSEFGGSLVLLGISGETASRETCSLPPNCSLYAARYSHYNIDSFAVCSLLAPHVSRQRTHTYSLILCSLIPLLTVRMLFPTIKRKKRVNAILLAILI